MFHMSKATEPVRSYDRTWEEIETMLDKATVKMIQWKEWYEECKSNKDKEGMKESARNHKALQGVVKTLTNLLNPWMISPTPQIGGS